MTNPSMAMKTEKLKPRTETKKIMRPITRKEFLSTIDKAIKSPARKPSSK